MQCPSCGDFDLQDHYGPIDEHAGHTRYRCQRCGRLYAIPTDIAELCQRFFKSRKRFSAMRDDLQEPGIAAGLIAASTSQLYEIYQKWAKGGESPSTRGNRVVLKTLAALEDSLGMDPDLG